MNVFANFGQVRRCSESWKLLGGVDFEGATITFGHNRDFFVTVGLRKYIEHAVAKKECAFSLDSKVLLHGKSANRAG